MKILRNSFSCLLTLTTCAVVFYSVAQLILFLSTPLKYSLSLTWFYGLLDNPSKLKEIATVLSFDAVLIIGFILSHSLCKTNYVKDIWREYGLGDWERSVYNLISSSALLVILLIQAHPSLPLIYLILFQFLIIHWRPLPGISLWEVDVFASRTVYWTYNLIHGLCWFTICFGSVLMDLPELLGVVHVYCGVKDIAVSPLQQKSVEYRRLLGHIRHPSFLCITVVLWCVNIMTLDRALLATLWTLYMYVAWNPDMKDCAYQRSQLSRKKYELKAQF